MDEEHCTAFEIADDVVGDGAEQRATEAAATVRTHDDDAAFVASRHIEDGRCRALLDDLDTHLSDAADREARPHRCEFVAHGSAMRCHQSLSRLERKPWRQHAGHQRGGGRKQVEDRINGAKMRDRVWTIAVLHQLRALGVELAIDDFGTGHSSLSYLSSLPVDILKIDQACVHVLADNPTGTAIVNAIVAVAHTLSMQVTAEGVETAGHLALINGLGCDRGQGYHLAMPMEPSDFEELLRNPAIPAIPVMRAA